jgi:surface antigen
MRKKQNPLSSRQHRHSRVLRVAVLALVLSLGFAPGMVQADDLQPLIDAVSKQISENQAIVNQKQAEGDTLQNKLTSVQADLNAARANLQLTKLQARQVEQDQEAAEARLDTVIAQLKENIAAAYKKGSVTPLEVLASSDTLSDFVGREEYYNSLRKKIEENMQAVEDTQNQLNELERQLSIKAEQERLEEESIRVKERDVAELLAETRGQEGTYRQLVEQDRARLLSLRAQQSAAIAAQSAGREYSTSTSYPWSGVEPFPSYGVDPWGFYFRQCTSYAAWRRDNIGRPLPARWGFLGPANAKQWPDWGRKFGMRVDSQPEVGALAIYPVGEYGHVMVVEGIVSNGNQVLVSEFNAAWDGRFSQSLWPVSALVFIH